MRLIDEHGLAIVYALVVVVVVQGRCCWAAANDGTVGLHAASFVLELTVRFENALQVALPHAVLDLLKHLDVPLYRDLGGPAHHVDLMLGLSDTCVRKHLVHGIPVDAGEGLPVLLIRKHIIHS